MYQSDIIRMSNEVRILIALKKRGSAFRTLTELYKMLDMTQASTEHIKRKLESAGLVRSSRHGRCVSVELTPRGDRLAGLYCQVHAELCSLAGSRG